VVGCYRSRLRIEKWHLKESLPRLRRSGAIVVVVEYKNGRKNTKNYRASWVTRLWMVVEYKDDEVASKQSHMMISDFQLT
jgi:hypothetical protein